MLTAEVSLYPLKTTDASNIINNSIKSLDKQQLQYTVGSLSTHFKGEEQQVWAGLQAMFREAEKNGEVNMVVTLSNAAD